jgi:hypothetical protein
LEPLAAFPAAGLPVEARVLNEALREELLAMRDADLHLRDRLIASGALFGAYNDEMASLHRKHSARLREMLAAHGWPGRSLVGEDGCNAAWLVLQHAILDPPLMKSAQPLLEQAIGRGDAPATLLAYLVDRIQALQGLPQVYGTQHDWDDSGNMSPLPIEDAQGAEQRRAALGMETLEAQTARLRRQAALDGDRSPADLESYRRGADEWARTIGWRT